MTTRPPSSSVIGSSVHDTGSATPGSKSAVRARKWPGGPARRGLLIGLCAIAVFAAIGGVFWVFGTPQQAPVADGPAVSAGKAPTSAPGAGGVPDGGGAAGMGGVPAMGGGDPSAIGKKAPPADPDSPLAIQIPGCVCHSDDPKLVQEHAQYRMNQCFGCHDGR